jgi:hypothetical protein
MFLQNIPYSSFFCSIVFILSFMSYIVNFVNSSFSFT